MTLLAIVLILWLVLATRSAAHNVERTNAELAEQLGDAYRPELAGQPWRDGCGVVLLAAIATVALLMLATSVVPLPNG